ncbi:hypothetical protein HYPSUDRAFT_1056909 [Hypholoma sublateritium FD-334 SS-4]|uniref:Cysteine-rich transmembrane CYSTM domain-containing protein n=1 Tax=Hypholoma sublateritium (strain FD-334 SS-4) TaxID=945553 RepID=A0A0D2NJN4_HYPSF|nr:hypothetical protein HYPSUDRAFT_1056909 [Hypholoma sublateritium FD-334 SS-4]
MAGPSTAFLAPALPPPQRIHSQNSEHSNQFSSSDGHSAPYLTPTGQSIEYHGIDGSCILQHNVNIYITTQPRPQQYQPQPQVIYIQTPPAKKQRSKKSLCCLRCCSCFAICCTVLCCKNLCPCCFF